MGKAKVPLFNQPRNFTFVEEGATVGATIGTNLYNADGTLFDLSQLVTGGSTTVINGTSYAHDKRTGNSITILASDDKKIIELTYAGAITVTVSGLIPFSQGFDFIVFCTGTGGQATFVGTNSMVITSSDSLKTRTQYSPVGLMVDETLQATLYGDIEPVFPALTVLARAPNSSGAPSPLPLTADGQVIVRRAGALVASALNSGEVAETTNLFFTEPRVRATPLTGFAVGSNITVDDNDSIIEAFGKLQTQINLNVSGALTGIFKFSTSTVASDPSSGSIKFNNASYASITSIYISQTTDAGTDAENYLKTLRVDDQLYIQERDDSQKWVRLLITGTPTDNGSWWTISCSVISNGAGAMISNNAKTLFTIGLSTSGGGGGGVATSIDDANKVANLTFWTGTLAQYEALGAWSASMVYITEPV